MNRRNFLKLNLLSLAGVGVAYANPHMGHDMMDHDMMGHMGHDMMDHDMMGHEGHDMDKMPINREIDTSFIQFAQKDLKLLDQKYFPKGEALKALPVLKNESKEKNVFRATIEVKESQIEVIKGKKTKFYTYNGLIPAPKIEVYEGDKVEILVKNT
ncbi:MAG: multicopper oxidase domain-containing protein, partial [Campylobacter lanienae]|uniref:multicopper oxidase domain-containing protein n=2 Tax=Campylobacteraceae TaxID=72294 RepID=UPI00242EACD7